MSKASKKPVPITDMRRLRLVDGDILVVKEDVVASPGQRSALLQSIQNIVNRRVLVVFTDSLSNIKRLEVAQILNAIGRDRLFEAGYLHRSEIVRLSEEEIRSAGWVRPEEIADEDD